MGDAGLDDGAVTSGATRSYWQDTVDPMFTEPLREDASADVAVVGGGIAGLTAAYMLMREGKDVILVEDGGIASGESGRTTAHFTAALDDRYHALERKHGEDGARRAAESHTAAIEAAAAIVKQERIACALRRVPGYLFLHPSDKPKSLEKELDACKRAGLPVELLDSAPGFDSGPAILFPEQMQLHPMLYFQGLARALHNGGGRVHTRTHARKFTAGGFEANGHKVRAGRVVIATNSPVHTKIALHAKQAAYRTFVIAAKIPKGSVPHALWWDTGDFDAPRPFPPYHYVRLHEQGDDAVLLVGGEDHKTGQPETSRGDPFAALEAWTRERFPVGHVTHRWSGQVFEPADHLGFIGRDPTERGTFLATGDSGNGMTHGTLAGMLAVQVALGRETAWTRLYDPARKALGGLAIMAREGANSTAKYADWLRPGDVRSADELAPGQGAVIGTAHPRAVYRDEAGALHACSAVCPHLGCLVRWNGLEKSFDCPCHGSRFTATGKVLSGPSNADLPAVEEEHGAERARGSRPARQQKQQNRKHRKAPEAGAGDAQ